MENTVATKTQEEQWMVQDQVFRIYNLVCNLPAHAQSVNFEIRRDSHVEYLTKSLKQLGPNFAVLDANRPWLCYWIIHSISLMGDCLDDKLENDVIEFLNRCQDPNGGYGGGPGQMPHLATTYAAVNTLITVGGDISLSSINRKMMYAFFLRMKDKSGGFRMHDGGEIDVRASYTAIAVASVLNILDDRLIENVGHYISSCQTYEGGIAGEPGSEAHGGYTYCGLAAMVLIDDVRRLNLPRLINWVVFRQGVECGFQGRTNKLVDGCYSFWQGGTAAIIQRLLLVVNEQLGISNASHPVELNKNGDDFIQGNIYVRRLFNSMALQQYILLCSQEEAGFRDKPGKHRDHYHTCYVLSGLSICHYSGIQHPNSPPLPRDVFGPYSNLLEPVHPLYNIVLDKYYEAREFFARS
ncbi:protein farnesyltransferase subunit beta [Henckelia pumila]|uniref:protein farnesyltransferase subunit beta n=1 Tax=Henckelia pumila TaxID=405737 RepID=UPI003C6E961C